MFALSVATFVGAVAWLLWREYHLHRAKHLTPYFMTGVLKKQEEDPNVKHLDMG